MSVVMSVYENGRPHCVIPINVQLPEPPKPSSCASGIYFGQACTNSFLDTHIQPYTYPHAQTSLTFSILYYYYTFHSLYYSCYLRDEIYSSFQAWILLTKYISVDTRWTNRRNSNAIHRKGWISMLTRDQRKLITYDDVSLCHAYPHEHGMKSELKRIENPWGTLKSGLKLQWRFKAHVLFYTISVVLSRWRYHQT